MSGEIRDSDIEKSEGELTDSPPETPAMEEKPGENDAVLGTTMDDVDLTRTKSIAQSMSLGREISFIAVVCMAQVLTRKSTLIRPL